MARVIGPKVLEFTERAWRQMWTLTDTVSTEVSALGICAKDRRDVVEEFYVPKQVCTSVRTEMDPDSVSELTLRLLSEGIEPWRLCVWWH